MSEFPGGTKNGNSVLVRECKQCKKEFKIKLFRVKMGWGKFCSRKCRALSARKGRYIKCSKCSKEFWCTQTRERASKSGKHFCSKMCLGLSQRTKNYYELDKVFLAEGTEIL